MSAVATENATILPAEVAGRMEEIVDWAGQAAGGAIADWLEITGYPITGDIAPELAIRVDELMTELVNTLALNNAAIAALNEEV